MWNGRDMTVLLIVRLIKRTLYENQSILYQLYKSFDGNINVKVELSNYATKTDLKNVTHLDTSSFAPKSNLASQSKNWSR